MSEELKLPCISPEELYERLVKEANGNKNVLNDLNVGDDRFCIVNWASGKDLYNVLSMGLFFKPLNGEPYKLDENYKCYWDDFRKYRCSIKFIGTLQECYDQEANFKPADQNTNLRATIKKKATSKNAQEANDQATTKVQLEIAQRELSSNKEIMQAQSAENEKLKQEINRLRNASSIATTLANNNSSNIDFDSMSLIDKNKFLKVAKCIMNIFGSRSDVDELEIKDLNDDQMVHLTPKYAYKVKETLKRRINKMKQDKEKPTAIIRFLINNITESMDEKEKGAYKAETFKKKFKDAYDASNGNFYTHC
jgi:hypothetical protein